MKKKMPLSIYIHIPFCIKKCLYCDFLSFPAGDDLKGAYVKALVKEIKAYAKELPGYYIYSVFLGGGTPSLLSCRELEVIFNALRESFDFGDEKTFPEITIEANPGTVDREFLNTCMTCGVNRISMGLQSADDNELKMLGRIHCFEDFKRSFDLCREAGFKNINLDLMSALPGQTEKSWEANLLKVLNFKSEHISAYSLIIEEGTPFYDMTENKGALPELPGEDADRKMYEITRDILSSYGYGRYEISNYAKSGYESLHNITYWKRGDYIGFGIGAASFVDNRRFSNTRDIKAYIEGDHLYKFHENGEKYGALYLDDIPKLEMSEQMEETMFLGLRMMEGVSLSAFKEKFGSDILDIYKEPVDKYISMGMLKIDNSRLCLTDRGIDVSNVILSEFLL